MKTTIKHSLQTFVGLIVVASFLTWLSNLFGFGKSHDEKNPHGASLTHHVYSDASAEDVARVLAKLDRENKDNSRTYPTISSRFTN